MMFIWNKIKIARYPLHNRFSYHKEHVELTASLEQLFIMAFVGCKPV